MLLRLSIFTPGPQSPFERRGTMELLYLLSLKRGGDTSCQLLLNICAILRKTFTSIEISCMIISEPSHRRKSAGNQYLFKLL